MLALKFINFLKLKFYFLTLLETAELQEIFCLIKLEFVPIVNNQSQYIYIYPYQKASTKCKAQVPAWLRKPRLCSQTPFLALLATQTQIISDISSQSSMALPEPATQMGSSRQKSLFPKTTPCPHPKWSSTLRSTTLISTTQEGSAQIFSRRTGHPPCKSNLFCSPFRVCFQSPTPMILLITRPPISGRTIKQMPSPKPKSGLKNMPNDPYPNTYKIIHIFFYTQMNPTSPYKLEKRPMLMEKFIHLLLIFRVFLKELPPLPFAAIVVVLLIIKKFKEGFTVGTVGQIFALGVIFTGDILQWKVFTHWGTFIAALNYLFLEPTLYKLPEFKEKVGLRENFSHTGKNNKLYWVKWFPLENPHTTETYKIKWARNQEISKMVSHRNLDNPKLFPIFKIFMSAIDQLELKFGKGKEANSKETILFSHGRTATPFMYTNFFKAFARDREILAPQHSQVRVTPYTELEKIKKFREKQVLQRAQEIVYLAGKVDEKKEIVLMGHSYGCSTILTAYHILPLSIRKRVKKIVLFDPWLFPLTETNFEAEITCRVLMLANEFFLENQDVYERNQHFLKRNAGKIHYLCWKGADHLHQCDPSYVAGSTLWAIKNHRLAGEMLEKNIQAVEMFFQFEEFQEGEQKLAYQFKGQVLDQSYRPSKWSNKLNF